MKQAFPSLRVGLVAASFIPHMGLGEDYGRSRSTVSDLFIKAAVSVRIEAAEAA